LISHADVRTKYAGTIIIRKIQENAVMQMNGISFFFRWFFWLMLGMVFTATTVIYFFSDHRDPSSEMPVYGQLQDFSFISHTNAPFGLAQMQNKVNIVDFIFTSCGAACPRMATEMRELYHHFAQEPDVQFISISVDPQNDTIERLQKYAQGYGVSDKRWAFLRGPIDEVSDLAEKGFHVSGDFPANHSTKFVLVDQQGKIRGYYDSYDSESLHLLRKHIGFLLKKRR